MLGRQVLLRLRFPSQSSSATALVIRKRISHLPTFSVQALRTYATPGRPRSTVGEPSRTVKRDVKRQARAPKSTTGAKAAKKPKAKAAPKKKQKKVLTEAQLERRKASADKEERIRLKKVALLPSFVKSDRPAHAYAMFVKDRRVRIPAKGEQNPVGIAFKALSPAEREHYNHLAVTEAERKSAERKAFIESHTVEQIRVANNARAKLNRMGVYKNKLAKLKDPRDQSSRAKTGSYALFTRERWASGDMKGISAPQAAKLIGQEWRALSADEKSKYAVAN